MTKTAIVTGSSRGIGKAIALRLARDGYDVCVNDIAANKQGCEEVAKEIQDMGRKSCVAVADVTKLSEVQGMIETSVEELGELSTMCACHAPQEQKDSFQAAKPSNTHPPGSRTQASPK